MQYKCTSIWHYSIFSLLFKVTSTCQTQAATEIKIKRVKVENDTQWNSTFFYYDLHNFPYSICMRVDWAAEAYFVACSVRKCSLSHNQHTFCSFFSACLLAMALYSQKVLFHIHSVSVNGVFGSPIFLSQIKIEVVPFDTLMHFPFDKYLLPQQIDSPIHTLPTHTLFLSQHFTSNV